MVLRKSGRVGYRRFKRKVRIQLDVYGLLLFIQSKHTKDNRKIQMHIRQHKKRRAIIGSPFLFTKDNMMYTILLFTKSHPDCYGFRKYNCPEHFLRS